MAHGDAREEKWRGNWRMQWVASTLTLPRNVVYPALLPLMRTTRLPAVDWTDAPTDLNGLVRFTERWNLVFARVPSRSSRAILKIFRWPRAAKYFPRGPHVGHPWSVGMVMTTVEFLLEGLVYYFRITTGRSHRPSYSVGTGRSFHGIKAAGSWNRPLTN